IPIIKRLLDDSARENGVPVFIDCPPGSACIVMESIRDADYCVLVAEPTVFGAHNLNMVYELVTLFHKPCGVVLNKCIDGGENPSEAFSQAHGVPVVGRIPFNNVLGRLSAEGIIAAREKHEYAELFSGILQTVRGEVRL
ncbi:MAG: ATPase, partial [Bacillota bacterium]